MRKINLILISAFLFLAACDAGVSNTSQSNPTYSSNMANSAETAEVEKLGGGGGGGRSENQPFQLSKFRSIKTPIIKLSRLSPNEKSSAMPI